MKCIPELICNISSLLKKITKYTSNLKSVILQEFGSRIPHISHIKTYISGTSLRSCIAGIACWVVGDEESIPAAGLSIVTNGNHDTSQHRVGCHGSGDPAQEEGGCEELCVLYYFCSCWLWGRTGNLKWQQTYSLFIFIENS